MPVHGSALRAEAPLPGFGDPVHDAQGAFRAVMMALARPGSIQPLVVPASVPAPLTPELAALALTLADHEATLWLDPLLAGSASVGAYLRFHTGATIVADPLEASFALIADAAAAPPLVGFAQGSDEYPDRSTTLVYAVASLQPGDGFTLTGPGVEGTARLAVAPLPADFAAQFRANHARFPRGVDCVFLAPGAVAALPRSTALLTEA